MSGLSITALPGKPVSVAITGLPTGMSVGYQVLKAASSTVAIGRTTAGLSEQPAGSGNYVATFPGPVEPDLYLVLFDWNGGVIDPATSETVQLVVSEASPTSTGLGSVADHARLYLGGETWSGISNSPNYGTSTIATAIAIVKQRVMNNPPSTVNESMLPELVLSYLGKLVALELIPAARDWWANQAIAKSLGDDPVEVVTYPSRETMLDAIQEDLLRQVQADALVAVALLPDPRVNSYDLGPDIDEDDSSKRVTVDPRCFPRYEDFPHPYRLPNRARERVIW